MGSLRVAAPPERPLLLWDGGCGLCRRWAARWTGRTKGKVDSAPYQTAAWRFPEISPDALAAAVHLVEPDGSVSAGAEAAFRTLAHARRGWGLLRWAYERIPGVARMSEAAYRWLAARRCRVS